MSDFPVGFRMNSAKQINMSLTTPSIHFRKFRSYSQLRFFLKKVLAVGKFFFTKLVSVKGSKSVQ